MIFKGEKHIDNSSSHSASEKITYKVARDGFNLTTHTTTNKTENYGTAFEAWQAKCNKRAKEALLSSGMIGIGATAGVTGIISIMDGFSRRDGDTLLRGILLLAVGTGLINESTEHIEDASLAKRQARTIWESTELNSDLHRHQKSFPKE